ncbi:MAG: hypothetical protein LBG48_04725 [Rickettsiales bacterium]|jgi:predicted PurR-regulated permease PerM|nr:hypothetical protein [Rickettsiales bacterium]
MRVFVLFFIVFLVVFSSVATQFAWAETEKKLNSKEGDKIEDFFEKHKNNPFIRQLSKIIDFFSNIFDKMFSFINSFFKRAIKSNQSWPINYF